MRKTKRRKTTRAKTKLGLPDLEQAKSAVLASLRSPESRRSYQHSIDEFVLWYCSEPRLSFNKTVVTRYRIHLEGRQLAPGTINVRLAAVRRAKKISNAHIFEAVISRCTAQRKLIDEFLSLFGGQTQPLMAHLIESGKLTLKDVQEAEKILRKLAKRD